MSEFLQLVDAETRSPVRFPVTEPFLEGRSTCGPTAGSMLGEDREVPVELSASPLRSPEGTLFGILYVFRETSERERIQNVVLRQLEELAMVQKRLLPSRETAIPGIRFDWMFIPTHAGRRGRAGVLPPRRSRTRRSMPWTSSARGSSRPCSPWCCTCSSLPRSTPAASWRRRPARRRGPRVLSPAEVVKKLNTRFYLRDDANPYFTMTYATMEPATGRLRLVRAGHPFPILQRADGAISQLPPEGYAVGLFPSADIASEELELESGDRLFLYSDGLVDCANPAGLSFGAKRLEEAIKAGRTTPLSDMVKNLRQSVISWRGSEVFNDDVSLLAIEKE